MTTVFIFPECRQSLMMRAACLLQPRGAPAGAVWDAHGCCATLGRRTCGEWQCRWPSATAATWTSPSRPRTHTHMYAHTVPEVRHENNFPVASSCVKIISPFPLKHFISSVIQSSMLIISSLWFSKGKHSKHTHTVSLADTQTGCCPFPRMWSVRRYQAYSKSIPEALHNSLRAVSKYQNNQLVWLTLDTNIIKSQGSSLLPDMSVFSERLHEVQML